MPTPPSFSVTLEEHVVLPALGDNSPFFNDIWKTFPQAQQGLRDTSTGRIADMDAGHVSYQVMSHLPGMAGVNPDGCVVANDQMAEAIKRYPTRLGGFAALPMSDPKKAAAELERAVKELGLVGAMLDNHLPDLTFYDDERFWIVFETAQRLDVPLYFHPAPPPPDYARQRFGGNYSDVVKQGLSTGAWGWHESEGLHILKLYAAGVFERFPKLKIIIGHCGEMLPMMIDRNDNLKFFQKGGLGKFSDVWEKNIWVTSSGIFSVRTLDMLLKVTKKDRVLYSIDTPFNKNILGWKFLQELSESGLLSQEELDMFAFGNAKKLLKLDVDLQKV